MPRKLSLTGGPLRPTGGLAAAAVAAQPISGRLAFPPHYYHTRRPDQSQPKTMGGGAPKRFGPKQTTYGYEMQPGQQPQPWKPRGGTRPRADACRIRPERNVTISMLLLENNLVRGPQPKAPRLVYTDKSPSSASKPAKCVFPSTRTASAGLRVVGLGVAGGAGFGATGNQRRWQPP